MFVVHHSYHDRAIKYVRLNGFLNMAQGSGFGDVLEVVRDYGIVPQSVYSGMNYGTELPAQGELDAVLKGYVQAVVKNPNKKLTPVWTKGFDGILDAYLGEIPETFVENGVTYTPQSYEVEDNWRWGLCYNLPLDEFMAVIDNAVENGYTVAWGGDVSEAGFTRDGLAILVDTSVKPTGSDQERWVGPAAQQPAAQQPKKELPKEIEVTQENRQKWFDEKTSTDDHGMHLYGIAKDQNGTKYYLIKNSWGVTGAPEGYRQEAGHQVNGPLQAHSQYDHFHEPALRDHGSDLRFGGTPRMGPPDDGPGGGLRLLRRARRPAPRRAFPHRRRTGLAGGPRQFRRPAVLDAV